MFLCFFPEVVFGVCSNRQVFLSAMFLSKLTASVEMSVTKLAQLRSGKCSVLMPEDIKGVRLVPWHQHLSVIPSCHGIS